jgi:hypothetical protein
MYGGKVGWEHGILCIGSWTTDRIQVNKRLSRERAPVTASRWTRVRVATAARVAAQKIYEHVGPFSPMRFRFVTE